LELEELELDNIKPLETFSIKSHDAITALSLEKIKQKLQTHKTNSIISFLNENNIFIPETFGSEIF